MSRIPVPCSVEGCSKPRYCKTYCSTHYMRFSRHGDPTVVVKPRAAMGTPVEERFWPLVQRTDSCWIWAGFIDPNGYGRFTIRHGKQIGAHRLSWILAHGPIADERLEVGHNCPGGDNKRCVNPAHLLLLTPKEHGADRVNKGQQLSGDKSGPRRHPERMVRGERQHSARLTADQIRDIRERHQTQGASKKGLAREFGVTQRSILKIIRRETWAHIL